MSTRQDRGEDFIGDVWSSGPPDAVPADPVICRRRRVILALNVATIAAIAGAMAAYLSPGGIRPLEWVMLAAFTLTLPWLSIGVWNALLGFWLELRHDGAGAAEVTPALARVRGSEPVTARVAIVMALRNEDPEVALARLQRLEAGLGRSPWAGQFDFHVLSDTDAPEFQMREETVIARWRRARPAARIHYRRRTDNTGYKAGNIAEFVQRCRDEYDFFLPLDADSEMGADAVLHMVRVMQASPELGMLQGLVVGAPAKNFFTRAFQFGMRQGMRSYTLGSAWWQADCGPNWGHNLLIRTAPFADHCMLPLIEGRGPLAGHVMSHDQVEAVLMRRAGYQVRVLAEEADSREENPPSLVDFIRRELRWCYGNMQYLRLLRMEGLRAVSRLQLLLAIKMYLSSLAWITFLVAGAICLALPGHFVGGAPIYGYGLLATVMVLGLMPKLMGLGQVLARGDHAARYGGRARVLAGGIAEIFFSMLVAPAVAVAVTLMLIGLPFGRRIGWQVQQRSRDRLAWSEAARALWPQTLFGGAFAVWLAVLAPGLLWIASPVLASLLGAIPFAVLSTRRGLGIWSRRVGLFDIPEERRRRSRAPEPVASMAEPA